MYYGQDLNPYNSNKNSLKTLFAALSPSTPVLPFFKILVAVIITWFVTLVLQVQHVWHLKHQPKPHLLHLSMLWIKSVYHMMFLYWSIFVESLCEGTILFKSKKPFWHLYFKEPCVEVLLTWERFLTFTKWFFKDPSTEWFFRSVVLKPVLRATRWSTFLALSLGLEFDYHCDTKSVFYAVAPKISFGAFWCNIVSLRKYHNFDLNGNFSDSCIIIIFHQMSTIIGDYSYNHSDAFLKCGDKHSLSFSSETIHYIPTLCTLWLNCLVL